jgi:hypothetical protein
VHVWCELCITICTAMLSLADFPPEILELVFAFCETATLIPLRQVCNLWEFLIEREFLKRKLLMCTNTMDVHSKYPKLRYTFDATKEAVWYKHVIKRISWLKVVNDDDEERVVDDILPMFDIRNLYLRRCYLTCISPETCDVLQNVTLTTIKRGNAYDSIDLSLFQNIQGSVNISWYCVVINRPSVHMKCKELRFDSCLIKSTVDMVEITFKDLFNTYYINTNQMNLVHVLRSLMHYTQNIFVFNNSMIREMETFAQLSREASFFTRQCNTLLLITKSTMEDTSFGLYIPFVPFGRITCIYNECDHGFIIVDDMTLQVRLRTRTYDSIVIDEKCGNRWTLDSDSKSRGAYVARLHMIYGAKNVCLSHVCKNATNDALAVARGLTNTVCDTCKSTHSKFLQFIHEIFGTDEDNHAVMYINDVMVMCLLKKVKYNENIVDTLCVTVGMHGDCSYIQNVLNAPVHAFPTA